MVRPVGDQAGQDHAAPQVPPVRPGPPIVPAGDAVGEPAQLAPPIDALLVKHGVPAEAWLEKSQL